jgi:hypothetical protein
VFAADPLQVDLAAGGGPARRPVSGDDGARPIR